ncbi:hypothetical protein PL263_10205 [Methylomonas sp. EFPC3]|uniref:hypothetical protein n=1 Tax=Methylomonas sp. EFPC3 TaxID=3021710 RepID=UPI002416CB33|nr:hypothetical protein [Methylomonas sp. EFPC3]WFP48486.1 hypothetical protein PL263_10205 [Methylomonas sp. EFPC3]
MSTARNNGFPAGGDLRLDSVIKAGGTELTIENAMHMGWVRQAANGFEWIGPGSHPEVKKNPDSSQISPAQNTQEPPTDQREESQQKLPEGVEPFTPEVEAQVAQAISGIPQPMISEAVVHVLEHGPESLNYDQLASLTGLSAAEVQQRAASVIGAFTAQADSIAKSMGIQEPQELWNWLHTNRGDAMKRAQRDMAFNRDTRMLRQLIQHAKDSLGPDEGSLKAAGYQTHVNDYGELLVNINGAWTLASVAQKMRLI